MINSKLPRNVDESESANFEQSINIYELEPNEVSTGTFEPELTTGGR
mgnify:FL=1